MKIRILSSLLVLFFSLTITAQTQYSVTGSVKDDRNLPVAFSNIALLQTDSAFVNGCTSDEQGQFTLKDVQPNKYLLKISYIGYVSQFVELIIQNTSVDIGNVTLSEMSQVLDEVVVNGRSIIRKLDRTLILPTQAAKKNAYNSYDLMFNMAIPHLQVSPLSKELSANGGGVQTRINGVIASQAEVAALLPSEITRIEMIENPGERYGDGSLGAVIDIIVRHREEGGLINIQTTNSPHVLFGDNNITAKYNRGKSQWGLNYTFAYRGVKKNRTDKSEVYNLNDKTIRREQKGINDRSRWSDQNIDLSYNLTSPGKYVFNAVFRNNIHNAPHQDESNKLFDAANSDQYILSKVRANNDSYSPALDLYFQRTLPKDQILTLNLTGTLIRTNTARHYWERTVEDSPLADFETNVEGNKRSIIGEGIYDKRFKKVMLTAGMRHYQMYAKNEYKGSNPMTSEMNQMRSSAFVELQGNLKKVSYGVSAGLTRSYFKESGMDHTYYMFTPTVRLGFAPHKNGYLNYRFNTDPQIPSLGSLTNVEQFIDTLQIVRGNPALKTYNVYNNNLNYSYNKDKFVFMMNVNHSYRNNCIMENVFVENNRLIIMEDNQRSHQLLEIAPALIFRSLDLGKLKNFLTIGLEGGFVRYWSNGNDYTHTYNNFFYNAQFMLSYKEFAFLGQFSKNKNTLLGETIYKGENQTALMATWTHKRLQLGAGMMFPFTNNYKTGKERVSKVAPYRSWTYTKEIGQMVAIRINYNFEFGHSYKSAKRRINNSDKDAGILKMGE